MNRGLSLGQHFIFLFNGLFLTWFFSEHLGPYVTAFGADIRRGVELSALGIYLREDTFYLNLFLYFVPWLTYFGGTFSVALWHWRSWTVIVTIAAGILWVAMAVFGSELSYSIARNSPRYPASLYWALGFYYLPIIVTCIGVWSEVTGHPESPKETEQLSDQ